jgi:hypothetical protein
MEPPLLLSRTVVRGIEASVQTAFRQLQGNILSGAPRKPYLFDLFICLFITYLFIYLCDTLSLSHHQQYLIIYLYREVMCVCVCVRVCSVYVCLGKRNV